MPSTPQRTSSTKPLDENTDKENDFTHNPASQLLPVHPVPTIYAYLQILCGCLAIVAGLTAYVVGTWRSEYGIGVWSGILFVAPGVTGFIAKLTKSHRTLLGFFFVSAFVAGITVTVIIFHVMVLRNEEENVTEERLFNFTNFSQETRRGLDALQTILDLMAFIVLVAGCAAVYKHLCRYFSLPTTDNNKRRDADIQWC